MLLTTPVRSTFADLAFIAPTVIQPGESAVVAVRVNAIQPCELLALVWNVPPSLKISPTTEPQLPVKLEAGRTFALQATLVSAGQEGFGEIQASLQARLASGQAEKVTWSAWLSIFKRQSAAGMEQLSDELRRRLVQVVNARARNGHILIADFVAFFDHFLNIEVPRSIAILVAQEMNLPAEGLPLSPEMFLEIVLGNKRFYGLDSLELIPEEECVESDDRFDPLDAREIAL